jgi:hypothetical protein
MGNDQKVTKKERGPDENRKKRSGSNARLARAATLSMKINNTGHICKKDFSFFKATFFNTKPLPYTRLNPLHKLLLCQFIMHTKQDNMQPTPFVFRLPKHLHGMDATALNKKLYRKLSGTLNRKLLFWTTREHEDSLDKTITHLNGEILLYPGELETVKQAFREIFGVTGKGVAHAIRSPLTKRNKLIQQFGEFYAIYNWPGYATKQDWQRDMYRRRRKIARQDYQAENGKYHYISGELGEMASNFYSERILRKSDTKPHSSVDRSQSQSNIGYFKVSTRLSRHRFDTITPPINSGGQIQTFQTRQKMRITEISLQEHADIYEAMTDRKEEKTRSGIFFSGKHPKYDRTILLFQNGCTAGATLIQPDVAA